jgi:peptide/nickel transport system substrate-binding protein
MPQRELCPHCRFNDMLPMWKKRDGKSCPLARKQTILPELLCNRISHGRRKRNSYRKMKKIIIYSLIIVLLFLSSCSNHQKHTGEKIIQFPAEDWGFPSPFAFYPAGPGYIKMSLIFDTLVWKDEKGIIPWLAESWHMSDDGKTWRFILRNGIKFHDGHLLTAKDVVFTFNYIQKHPFPWSVLSVIDSISAVSSTEVKFHLKYPYAAFLDAIIGIVPIVPEHIWSTVRDPKKYRTKEALVGTGPFILQEYRSEHGIYRYKANPDFFLGKPKIDGIAYIPCGDPVLGLAKGEINAHTLWRQQVDAVDRFRKDPRYNILEGPSNWLLKLIFNTKRPPLNDYRIRQAFAYAINRGELCKRVKHNHAIAGNPGMLINHSSWYNPDVEQYDFSLKKSRQLLNDAGYQTSEPGGIRESAEDKRLSFELLFGSENSREAEFIKDSMAQVGIEITFKIMDGRTIFTLMEEEYDDFDLAINGHGGIAGDPDLFRKWFENPVGNNGFWQNKTFNELIEKQARTLNPRERKRLVFQMQRILAHDLPVLVLWHPRLYFVYRPDVFNEWFYTKGGIAFGIPLTSNKLAFINRNELKN